MKGNENRPVKSNINRLRRELHKLIEDGNIDSEKVRSMSCELDMLILTYYGNLEKMREKAVKEG